MRVHEFLGWGLLWTEAWSGTRALKYLDIWDVDHPSPSCSERVCVDLVLEVVSHMRFI